MKGWSGGNDYFKKNDGLQTTRSVCVCVRVHVHASVCASCACGKVQ